VVARAGHTNPLPRRYRSDILKKVLDAPAATWITIVSLTVSIHFEVYYHATGADMEKPDCIPV